MPRQLLLTLILCLAAPGAVLAQDAVGDAEAAWLAVTPLPVTARHDAADWRRWRSEASSDEAAAMDADRVAELQAATARDRRLADYVIAPDALGDACPPLGLETCRIEAAGLLNLAADEESGTPAATLYWQQARGFHETGMLQASVILYTPTSGGRLQASAWVQTAVFHEPPQLIEGQGDLYVAVPGVHDGTGRMNADVLFRWTPGSRRPFTQIDVESWKAGLDAVLPPGLEIWKGVVYRWPSLTADTSLWQANDGNCCPTGGEAWMQFEVQGDVLALTHFDLDPSLDDFIMTTPTDAFDWMGRAMGCAHWGGEEPYDDERRAGIEAAMGALRCDALETDRAALTAKYADDPVLLARIARMGGGA